MPNPQAMNSSAASETLKAINWAVTVEPMLAPMMTPIDWDNDMSPALMKPTNSTVVTEDELMTAVTMAPVTAPMKRLRVRLARISFMRSPATALSALAMRSRP